MLQNHNTYLFICTKDLYVIYKISTCMPEPLDLLGKVFHKPSTKARIVKETRNPKKLAPIRVWFVGRAYRLHKEIENLWVEYRDPIDLMDLPSNLEIGYVGVKRSQ